MILGHEWRVFGTQSSSVELPTLYSLRKEVGWPKHLHLRNPGRPACKFAPKTKICGRPLARVSRLGWTGCHVSLFFYSDVPGACMWSWCCVLLHSQAMHRCSVVIQANIWKVVHHFHCKNKNDSAVRQKHCCRLSDHVRLSVTASFSQSVSQSVTQSLCQSMNLSHTANQSVM